MRFKRGALNFDTNGKIIVNKEGRPVDIVLRQRIAEHDWVNYAGGE